MPLGPLTPVYQPPYIEGEQVDIDVIEPKLNIDFKVNSPQQKELPKRYMRDQEGNTYRNHLNWTNRLRGRK